MSHPYTPVHSDDVILSGETRGDTKLDHTGNVPPVGTTQSPLQEALESPYEEFPEKTKTTTSPHESLKSKTHASNEMHFTGVLNKSADKFAVRLSVRSRPAISQTEQTESSRSWQGIQIRETTERLALLGVCPMACHRRIAWPTWYHDMEV